MSDQVLAILITAAIVALLFAWVPILNFICPPCGRALARYRHKSIAEDGIAPGTLRKPI
jgi:hypothetical protein